MPRTYFVLISMFNFSSSIIMTPQHKVMSFKCEAIMGMLRQLLGMWAFSWLFRAVNNQVKSYQAPILS